MWALVGLHVSYVFVNVCICACVCMCACCLRECVLHCGNIVLAYDSFIHAHRATLVVKIRTHCESLDDLLLLFCPPQSTEEMMGYVVITFQVDPRGSLLCTQQVSTSDSVSLQFNLHFGY